MNSFVVSNVNYDLFNKLIDLLKSDKGSSVSAKDINNVTFSDYSIVGSGQFNLPNQDLTITIINHPWYESFDLIKNKIIDKINTLRNN